MYNYISIDSDNYSIVIDINKLVAIEKSKDRNLITIYTVSEHKFHIGCANEEELNERYESLVDLVDKSQN